MFFETNFYTFVTTNIYKLQYLLKLKSVNEKIVFFISFNGFIEISLDTSNRASAHLGHNYNRKNRNHNKSLSGIFSRCFLLCLGEQKTTKTRCCLSYENMNWAKVKQSLCKAEDEKNQNHFR